MCAIEGCRHLKFYAVCWNSTYGRLFSAKSRYVNVGYVCGIESDGRHAHSRTGRCSGKVATTDLGNGEE